MKFFREGIITAVVMESSFFFFESTLVCFFHISILGWDIPQKCRPCSTEFLFPALNSGADKASSQVCSTLPVSWLLETYY